MCKEMQVKTDETINRALITRIIKRRIEAKDTPGMCQRFFS